MTELKDRLSWPSGSKAVFHAVAARLDVILVLLVMLVAAALRLVFFPLVPAFTHGDSIQYLNPARALLAGEGLSLPLERPGPLYPLFVALVTHWLGQSLERLVAVHHVLGVFTAGLTYAAGRLTFGRGAGIFGGLAAAVSGVLLMYEHAVMTEALFTFLLMLALVLYLLGLRQQSWWCYAGCGLLVGLATLTRPQAQFLLVLIPVGLAACYRRWQPVLRATALVWIVAALVLVPWAFRNLATHGAFFLSGSLGKQLVHRTVTSPEFQFFDHLESQEGEDPRRRKVRKALQEFSDGQARVPPLNISLTKTLRDLRNDLKIGELEFDNILRGVALEVIQDNPATYARLVAADVSLIAMGSPRSLGYRLRQRERSTGPEDDSVEFLITQPSAEQLESLTIASRLVTLYQSSWFGPLLPGLFLVGLLASFVVPGWRSALVPGLAVVAQVVPLAAITVGRFRYHYPIDPLMHVMAFGGLLLVWKTTTAAGARLARVPLPSAAWRRFRGLKTAPASRKL